MDRLALSAAMKPIQEAWSEALALASKTRIGSWPHSARDLWNQWDALWIFVDVEGVEPTNNEAERTLRPAVIWRKCCFRRNSCAGSMFVGRMLTVIETARRRGVHMLDFLGAGVPRRHPRHRPAAAPVQVNQPSTRTKKVLDSHHGVVCFFIDFCHSSPKKRKKVVGRDIVTRWNW
jgi:hypothetical protein